MAIADPVGRLSKIQLFRGLSPQALSFVGSLAQERDFPATSLVFSQGDIPTHFYVVMTGQVLETGTAGGAPVIRLEDVPGSPIGRWSAINGQPHNTTALVVQDATILSIEIANLPSLLARVPLLRQRLVRTEIASRLLAIPLFGSFTPEQLFQAADLLQVVELGQGSTIYTAGSPADAFYVIDCGRVAARGGGASVRAEMRYMGAGAFFGHEELLHRKARGQTVKADSSVTLYRFSASAFDWLLQLRAGFGRGLVGIDPAPLLAGISLFANLSQEDVALLAGYVGLAHLPGGHTLFAQGELDSTLYFLLDGQAERFTQSEGMQPHPLAPLQAGDAVGERLLFSEEPWAYTLRAASRTAWIYLTRQDLSQLRLRKPTLWGKLVPPDGSLLGKRPKVFSWLAADEEPLLVRRRHLLALVRPLLGWPGILFWVAAVVLAATLWQDAASGLGGTWWVPPLIIAVWALWCALDYANDILIVTANRVVHREKVIGLFESLSEVPLGKIQNVGIHQDFWGGLWGYGRLSVETAATSGIKSLGVTHLRAPELVKTLLLEAAEREEYARKPDNRRRIRERIEAATQSGLRAIVRLPASPPIAVQARTRKPGPVARALQATLGGLFWVERNSGDRVIWRKHPLRLLAKVWAPSLLAVVAGLAYGLLLSPLEVSPWFLVPVLVPLAAWWWWGWADWGNDLYIVTKDRIVDTERKPLRLRSERTETLFDRIQNVTYELPNLVANLFDFGTVSIYTAGAQGKLDFQYVAHPQKVQSEIFGRLVAFEEEQRRRRQEQMDLGDWFGVYEQTH
ncbi:MAG TPA: cyclic nucleotide-binding domain-containing protein [Anaerolineae bacterium]|nr:cyclic nucleotide-binding domain-containing protein [Anaerolineae bacterium]